MSSAFMIILFYTHTHTTFINILYSPLLKRVSLKSFPLKFHSLYKVYHNSSLTYCFNAAFIFIYHYHLRQFFDLHLYYKSSFYLNLLPANVFQVNNFMLFLLPPALHITFLFIRPLYSLLLFLLSFTFISSSFSYFFS